MSVIKSYCVFNFIENCFFIVKATAPIELNKEVNDFINRRAITDTKVVSKFKIFIFSGSKKFFPNFTVFVFFVTLTALSGDASSLNKKGIFLTW